LYHHCCYCCWWLPRDWRHFFPLLSASGPPAGAPPVHLQND
jgi:hypothetical protein